MTLSRCLQTRFLRVLVVASIVLASTMTVQAAYGDDTTTTTTPETTTTIPITPPTTGGGLDSDLPGATTLPPTGPTKEETIAQEQAKNANQKLDSATKKLLDAQLAADIASLDIQTTKATLLDLQDKITKNQALLAVRELPLNQLSKIIEKRAVTMYTNLSGAPTNAIDEFYFNRQNALSATAQSFNLTELKSYQKKVTELQTLKKTLNSQKTEAEVKQVQLEALSVELNKQLETAKQQYEKTATVFLDANALIGARLPVEGKMCPIAGPITHVDDWGNPRSGGRTHKGNDIFNAFGTPNVAIVAGRIEHNLDNLGGTGVNLYGDDGNMYYYAHLSAWAGDNRRVNQGEIIGYSGDSGNAKGGAPHTHFEIRLKGTQHVNPYPTIRIICGA